METSLTNKLAVNKNSIIGPTTYSHSFPNCNTDSQQHKANKIAHELTIKEFT